MFHVEISGEVRSAEEVAKHVTEKTERMQHSTRDSPFNHSLSDLSGEVRRSEEVAKRVTEQTERAQHNARDSPFKGIVSRDE